MLSRDWIALAPSLMGRSEDATICQCMPIVNRLDSQLANIDIRVKLKRCEYTSAVMKVHGHIISSSKHSGLNVSPDRSIGQ